MHAPCPSRPGGQPPLRPFTQTHPPSHLTLGGVAAALLLELLPLQLALLIGSHLFPVDPRLAGDLQAQAGGGARLVGHLRRAGGRRWGSWLGVAARSVGLRGEEGPRVGRSLPAGRPRSAELAAWQGTGGVACAPGRGPSQCKPEGPRGQAGGAASSGWSSARCCSCRHAASGGAVECRPQGRRAAPQPPRSLPAGLRPPGPQTPHPARLPALDAVLGAKLEEGGGGRVGGARQAPARAALRPGHHLEQVPPVLLSVLRQRGVLTEVFWVLVCLYLSGSSRGCRQVPPAFFGVLRLLPRAGRGRPLPSHSAAKGRATLTRIEGRSTRHGRIEAPQPTCCRLELNSGWPLPTRLRNCCGRTLLPSSSFSCGCGVGGGGLLVELGG